MQERRALRRIAATLLALASLAERAAGRSLPVRLLVLAILWRGEAIARAFISRTALADGQGEAWADFEGDLPQRGSASDAEILALRLRMLASALGILAGAPDENADGCFAALSTPFASGPGTFGSSAFGLRRRVLERFRRIRARSRDRPPGLPAVLARFSPAPAPGFA